MAGAFQMLRANDLVWSRMMNDYLRGERRRLNDLVAWNADSTRMHAEYLRSVYFENALAAGKLCVDGPPPVALANIRAPLFAVGADAVHVAPWRSVFKIHQLVDADVTFVLAKGGHNAGIVCEPGHLHRRFRIAEKRRADPVIGPDEWLAFASNVDGSWWLA